MKHILDKAEEFAMGNDVRMRALRTGKTRQERARSDEDIRARRRRVHNARHSFTDYDCKAYGGGRLA